MKRREPVSHIMTTDLITLNISDDLSKAESLFNTHHIRHIPVVEAEKVIGMLSKTDLLRISFVENYGESEANVDTAVYSMLSLSQVMTKAVETVDAGATIREVAEILSKHEFHALPVTENGELKGIVTTTDLIRYLLDQY